MSKHLSFWLGVFAAALVTVSIAAGIMGAAEQELRRIAVTVFVFVAGLVLALVIALFFRDWILRRLFGRAEATLDDVSASLIAGVSAATAGDRAAATAHAQELVQRGMGWYAWTGFYRWVIATAVALLLAFGAFMGTVLLFEQNRKLGEQTEVLRAQGERLAEQTGFMQAQTELMQAQTDRLQEQTEAAAMQNEIMTLNLVNELREQLLASIEVRPLGDWLRSFGLSGLDDPIVVHATPSESCALGFNHDHMLYSQASPAAIGAIEALTQSGALRERVIAALNLLTQDNNGGVALGAAVVLDNIDQPFLDGDIRLRNLVLSDPVFLSSPDYSVWLSGSYVFNLFCPDCGVHVGGSVLFQRTPHSLSGFGNVVFSSDGKNLLNGITASLRPLELPPSWSGERLKPGPYFTEVYRVLLTQINQRATCEEFVGMARINPMLKMMPVGVRE